MTDSHGRNIDYLRISVTDLCNLRCVYCMPEEGIEKMEHTSILTFEEIKRIVKILSEAGIRKLRITGGEPLVRRGITDLISELKKISGIEEIAMTTNGILLEKHAPALKQSGLDRVNVSIDSLIPEKYSEITRGGELDKVLRGIDAAISAGLTPLKVNTVVMKGVNDTEAADFARYALKKGIEWRFIEFMPLGGIGELQKDRYIPNDEIKAIIEKEFELERVYHREKIAVNYRIKGTDTHIGFISSMSHNFCASCNRMRLTADGRLVPCLLGDSAVDLRQVLRSGASDDAIMAVYKKALADKPCAHGLTGTHSMNRIGG